VVVLAAGFSIYVVDQYIQQIQQSDERCVSWQRERAAIYMGAYCMHHVVGIRRCQGAGNEPSLVWCVRLLTEGLDDHISKSQLEFIGIAVTQHYGKRLPLF
jgi:hypothetical protein